VRLQSAAAATLAGAPFDRGTAATDVAAPRTARRAPFVASVVTRPKSVTFVVARRRAKAACDAAVDAPTTMAT
jgi:hypothetical protein